MGKETTRKLTRDAKDEKDNLSQQERNSIKKVIEEIEKSLGGGCDER